MILMKDDLDREWQWLFLRCKNTAAAKAEILTLFSDEPDDEHEWSEQGFNSSFCGTTATLDRT